MWALFTKTHGDKVLGLVSPAAEHENLAAQGYTLRAEASTPQVLRDVAQQWQIDLKKQTLRKQPVFRLIRGR